MNGMPRAQALHLGQRVLETWPAANLSLDVWADMLTGLDGPAATDALRQLRDTYTSESGRAPTPGDFRVRYRSILERRDGDDEFTGRAPRSCGRCSGAGVDGEEYLIVGGPEAEEAGRAVVYTYPLPCRCSAGQRLPKARPHVDGPHRWSSTRPAEPPTDPSMLAKVRAMQEELRS